MIDLYKLQPRRLFSAEIKRHMRIDPADFFCNGDNQWLRDAWSASEFANATHAKKVSLVRDSSSDFVVEWRNDRLFALQTTVAGLEGRMIGGEYSEKKLSGYPASFDPESNWRKRRNAIPNAIKTAVDKKIKKNYSDAHKIGLFIYCNLGTYGCWKEEIESDLVKYTEPAIEVFSSVWVLWSSRVYRCWPNPFLRSNGAWRPNPKPLGWAINANPISQLLE